ncbi:norsolorinic acid reductase [Leptodontidium sp. 2 PMI_412]|nr:NADP-dependent oxidoreductase domain-containing protein [Leptodontidium sp. MPI-SDFR-AT-0119]KAH9207686.1 norsolorinic acid reductase [Leptodontidium sp. 2 PMI_412]
MAFARPSLPKAALGYYRLLAPTASVRVSPLCLGGMNFGESWADMVGACDHNAMLDTFYENGGNFIDTANNYQKGESERAIGEWMAKRGVRDQMVIATKYTTASRVGFGDKEIIVNTSGNGAKSLHNSVETSLKNLQTSYIDLLYIHWWDFTTSIPELMQSLNNMIRAGKVLYIGASDTPAWVVSKANQYARDHGLQQFSVYQGKWSAAARDFERDIIPMATDEGMALAPWGALGGGQFKTAEQRKTIKGRRLDEPSEQILKVCAALEKLAEKKETTMTSVALAYVMQKTPYVFPIVGGRTPEQLKGNIEALSLVLTKEEIDELEGAAPFDLGFPGTMIGISAGSSWLNDIAGYHDWVESPKPITPRKI